MAGRDGEVHERGTGDVGGKSVLGPGVGDAAEWTAELLDDPLAAASAGMRIGGSPAEQDATLGSLRIPAAAGEAFEKPIREPYIGDPGDEHDFDRFARRLPLDTRVQVNKFVEEVLAGGGELTSRGGRPLLRVLPGTLDDGAAERLAAAGLDVEVVDTQHVKTAEPDESLEDAASDDAVKYALMLLDRGDYDGAREVLRDSTRDAIAAVREVEPDGTVRELQLLEGGATDLAGLLPRRRCQAWIDLRFQYESDHPHGAPDEAEKDALVAFGDAVRSFAELLIENGMAEGMQIVSIVGHVLDKPGDPFPAS